MCVLSSSSVWKVGFRRDRVLRSPPPIAQCRLGNRRQSWHAVPCLVWPHAPVERNALLLAIVESGIYFTRFYINNWLFLHVYPISWLPKYWEKPTRDDEMSALLSLCSLGDAILTWPSLRYVNEARFGCFRHWFVNRGNWNRDRGLQCIIDASVVYSGLYKQDNNCWGS